MNETENDLAVEYNWLILQEKSIIDCLDQEILLKILLSQLSLSKNQGKIENYQPMDVELHFKKNSGVFHCCFVRTFKLLVQHLVV